MIATLMPDIAVEYSPDDMLLLPDQGKGYELVKGRLVELETSSLSSFVAGRLFSKLSVFVDTRQSGWVFPEGTSYQCFDGDLRRVRRPDTSFVLLERLSLEQVAEEGHLSIVPDLVVEVISPNDLAYKVNENLIEWQRAGVRLVWIVHPVQRTIDVHHADGTVARLRSGDTLTGEPLLPEFRVAVADLFAMPGA